MLENLRLGKFKNCLFLLLFLTFLIIPFRLISHHHLNLKLNSPRKTVEIFRKYMDEVFLGDYKNLLYVFECTEPDIDIYNYKFDTRDLSDALNLYAALVQMDYRNSEIPENAKGDKVTVKLMYKKTPVYLEFLKNSKGNWTFSRKTIHSEEIKKLSDERMKIYNDHFLSNRKDLSYTPNLISAAETFITFINGMEGNYGFNMADAISTLDMSNYSPIVREILGRYFSVMIYRIIKAEHKEISELSSDPTMLQPQILFIEPNVGSIVIDDVIDKKTNSIGWKFTKKTLERLPHIYRTYAKNKNTDPVAGLEHLAYPIVIDDWIYNNYPFFSKVYFSIELWKWIAVIIILAIAIGIYKLSKYILMPIYSFLKNHIFREKSRRAIYYCILPIRLILVVSWLWYTIGITAQYPYTRLPLIYTLGIMTDILILWAFWVILRVSSQIIIGKIIASKSTRITRSILIVDIVSKILQILVIIIGIYYGAMELGFDSAHILTAFGIGSIAIALAGKDTIENFFGTIMITLESPIRLNDWIIVDNYEGTVEKIGLRSTRVRTFKDSVITVPNAKFITTPVNNMGMRTYRRYDTMIGIEYNTPSAHIRDFIEGISNIIKTSVYTRKDYYIIRLNEFGEHSIEVLVYMFFETPDWEMELEAREDFIFKILALAEQLDIEIAIPSSTVFLGKKINSGG